MNIPKIDKEMLRKGLKNFFTVNVALKVIAFIFAMLLWGYVLTDQKPMRTKEITNVATSFEGEAELIAQGFCIRSDRAEILQDVAVTVRTQRSPTCLYQCQFGLGFPSACATSARRAREYDLPIQATVASLARYRAGR
ncbi:MAG: hypothetical protein R2881_07255 [Eubacteriales bacterium]